MKQKFTHALCFFSNSNWFQKKGSVPGLLRSALSSQLALLLFSTLPALLTVKLLTDWVSFVVDEGYTSEAAHRILLGQMPHRDFFFLWTPGTAYLHALIQYLGGSWVAERLFPLVAWAVTVAVANAQVSDYSLRMRWAFASLLALWGFGLWNIPYSSWYAVAFASIPALIISEKSSRSKAGFCIGLCFGCAFWFKQNVGIPAFVFFLFYQWWREWRTRSFAQFALTFFWVACSFLSVVLGPFIFLLMKGESETGRKFFEQIFLFPFQYVQGMNHIPSGWSAFLALLFLFFWATLSLLSKRRKWNMHGVGRFVFALWVGLFFLSSDSKQFCENSFLFFCLFFIVWTLLDLFKKQKLNKSYDILFARAFVGVAAQAFPRFDFQHLLFFFPLLAVGIFRFFKQNRIERKDSLAKVPIMVLFAAGVCLQSQKIGAIIQGTEDSFGRISYGMAHASNDELQSAIDFLRLQGMQKGDPLLVLPSATAFYVLSGFQNPTPHLQTFPDYIESFGQSQGEVFSQYEQAGGVFLVVQKRAGFSRFTPELYADLKKRYRFIKTFPIHFTLWEKKDRVPQFNHVVNPVVDQTTESENQVEGDLL